MPKCIGTITISQFPSKDVHKFMGDTENFYLGSIDFQLFIWFVHIDEILTFQIYQKIVDIFLHNPYCMCQKILHTASLRKSIIICRCRLYKDTEGVCFQKNNIPT